MSIASGHFEVEHHVDKVTRDVIGGGSIAAAAVGIASVALCILGLAGYYMVAFAAMAAILVGMALLIEGGSIAARANKLVMREMEPGSGGEGFVRGRREVGWALGGETAVQSLVGIIGMVLGVLAWSGIAPVVLLSVAAIVVGAGLLIQSASESMLGRLRLATYRRRATAEQITFGVVASSVIVDIVFGLLAMAIGIAALIGYVSFALVLVALLILGLGVLLGSSALASRFLAAFK